MNEVMVRFQSSRVKDKNDIEQFIRETERLIDEIKSNSETKKVFADRATETYNRIKNELPAGFVQDDLDLMNEIVKEIADIVLITPKKVSTLMG